MSYCKCGGYLGSGGVDGYAGRWCKCANPIRDDRQTLTTSETKVFPSHSAPQQTAAKEEIRFSRHFEDTHGMCNNNEITIVKDGWYEIKGRCILNGSPFHTRSSEVLLKKGEIIELYERVNFSLEYVGE